MSICDIICQRKKKGERRKEDELDGGFVHNPDSTQ